MESNPVKSTATTLSLDEFWTWLEKHPNCILRVSTPEVVLFDDDDLHWVFTVEDDETLLVQAVRGKRIAGEMFIRKADVTYVQIEPQEPQEEEFLFELVSENETSRMVAYQFALVHGLDEDPEPGPSGWRH